MRPFNNGSTDDGSEASPGQVNWSLAKFSEIWCLNGRIWDIWSLNEKIWDIWCQAANIRDIRCHRGATCCTKTKYHSFTRKSLRLNRPFCQSGGRRLSKLISEMGRGGFNWGWQLGFGRFKGMFVWVGKAPLSSIIQPGVRLNCPKNTHISDQWSFGESQEGGPNDNHIQQGLNDSLRVSPLVSISISGPLSCGFIPGGPHQHVVVVVVVDSNSGRGNLFFSKSQSNGQHGGSVTQTILLIGDH